MQNARLRLQLAAFQCKRQRSVLTSFDRLFWVGLSLIWNSRRAALAYAQPDTVARWQQERFRKFWARLSRVNRRRRGRLANIVEICRLIEPMLATHRPWRAPRIHQVPNDQNVDERYHQLRHREMPRQFEDLQRDEQLVVTMVKYSAQRLRSNNPTPSVANRPA
jgi:hypothetical protein